MNQLITLQETLVQNLMLMGFISLKFILPKTIFSYNIVFDSTCTLNTQLLVESSSNAGIQ